MKYFFTTKVKVVLIVAVLLTAGLAIIGNLLGKTPADKLVQGILTPLRTGASNLTAQAERFYNYMFRYEALEAENAALKQQIAQMKENALLTDSMEREIARLKELLLSHGRPTAIFTGRDCLAALVYAAANRAGLRIPEDLSVLGYDNITWPDGRYFGLSTIEQPASQIGRAAVEIMIRSWLAGSNEPESIRLAPGPLIQRESLAPVPKRIVRGGL